MNFFERKIKTFKRKSASEKVTYILFFAFFFIMAVAFVYPLWSVLMNSFRTVVDYTSSTRSPFALPETWYVKSWKNVFTEFRPQNYGYFEMLWNSLWMLVVKVSVNVLASTLLAYAVARYRFPGRNFLYATVIFAQTIPIIGSGAAGYKLFNALGFINNPALIWIAWASGFDFAFIVLYGTFKGISGTYSESARLDGANNWVVLFRIIMPQAMPCLVALAVTQAIGVWNDYSTSMIYMRKYPTLAYGLYIFGSTSEGAYVQNATALYSAAIVISLLPVLILYACSQKLILTNMTTGGLKG